MSRTPTPQDVTHETSETTETKPDGSTVTTKKRTTTVETSDIALMLGFLVFGALFIVSIFNESWRDAVFTSALPGEARWLA